MARAALGLALALSVVVAGATSAEPGDQYSQDSYFCGPLSDPSMNPQPAAYNNACAGGR